MASYNRVVLVGNMTRDAEIRYIQSGQAVTDIGLAVNDRRKDANGNSIDETTFVDITVWGRSAEILAEYTRKGSNILIEGRLKLDSWETDGQKRSKLKVVAERVVLMNGRGDNNSQQSWGGNRSGGYQQQGGYQQGGYQQQGGYSQQGGYAQGGGYSQQSGYSQQGSGYPQQGGYSQPQQGGQGMGNPAPDGFAGSDGFDAPKQESAGSAPPEDDIPF